MDADRFITGIGLLARLDFSRLDAGTASTLLKSCTPAFNEMVRSANDFMGFVAKNQGLFQVPEILAVTRPALEAAIFVANCGRDYEWRRSGTNEEDLGSVLFLVQPMQCAAIMGPRLAATTSRSLSLVNEALARLKAAREAAPPAPHPEPVPA